MTTRKRGVLTTALSLISFLFMQAALGETAWHTFVGINKSFTAELPSAPTYTTVENKTQGGSPYTLHQYVLDQGKIAYIVQLVSFPDDVDVSDPKVNLEGAANGSAKRMVDGKWTSIEWSTHQGLPAVETIGVQASGGMAVRSYMVMKGRELYLITYAGPSGTARSPDVDRALRSLVIAK
jgi:hypothetical protein